MSLDAYRRKLERLAEDDEADGEVTLAELILGSEETRERNRNIEALVDFARELAGTRPRSSTEALPAEAPPAVPPAPPASPTQQWETNRLFSMNAWDPAPLVVPVMDEKQRRAALVRSHRRRLMGYQISSAERMALMNQYPELQYVEGYEPPPPEPPPPPQRNPWKLELPSYASAEHQAEARKWGWVPPWEPNPEDETK